jgi:stage II sporulation protein AA (anti-sigma F factor antagonist)
MNTEIKEQNGTYVAYLTGWLDTNEASQFLEDIKPLEANIEKTIVIDCKDLEYVCSLALRGLLKLKKMSAAQGGSLILRNVTGEVQKILTMTGFIKLFDFE